MTISDKERKLHPHFFLFLISLCTQVVMTLVSIPLMDKTGRRTLHLYGLGGMFIFSIFITISFLIKASKRRLSNFPIIFLHSLFSVFQW